MKSNKDQIIEKLDSFLNNPEGMPLSETQDVVRQLFELFDELRQSMEKEDQREEALQVAQELQEKLQALAQQAYTKTGLSEEEISKFLASGQLPVTKESRVFEKTREEIKQYQDELSHTKNNFKYKV